MMGDEAGPTTETLKVKRACHKGKITLYAGMLEPLLSSKGLQAKNHLARVEDLSKKYNIHVSKFKELHVKIAERLETEAEEAGEAATLEVITENGEYVGKVEGEVYEVLERRKAFRQEVRDYNDKHILMNTTIPKIKTEYENSVKVFEIERVNTAIVLEPLRQIPKNDLVNSQGIKFLNVAALRQRLENAKKTLTAKYLELGDTLKLAGFDDIEDKISELTPEFEMSEANKE